MAFTLKTTTIPSWKRWLMALIGLTAAGCSPQPQPRYYAIPTFPNPSRNVALQQCAEHAALNLKARLPGDFKMIRLDADTSLLQAQSPLAVGIQPVTQLLDGRGIAYFAKESRVVTFHCLTDGTSNPLYTFVRPE